MLDSTVIVNARLPHRSGLYQISINHGYVQAISTMTAQSSSPVDIDTADANAKIDVEGDWISLGAVDLQINGALGLAFPDLRLAQLDRLQEICDFLWQQGISGFCPTLVTTSLENFQGSLAAIAQFQAQQRQQQQTQVAEFKSAQVIGVHLEGPFLNEAKRGAHPAEHLQALTLEAVKTLIGDYAKTVRIVTLAPEQTVDPHVIGWLSAQGITVSLGHSLANAAAATQAFNAGASMVTHAFNAMPGLHHRDPGLLGAAFTNPRVSCGFIADGEHISRTMLDVLLRIGRGERQNTDSQNTNPQIIDGLFLVSDALSPLGLPDGRYPWDSRTIEVIDGTARLLDGTLSGTTLPLIKGASNLVEWGLCNVAEAIALMTQAPRQAIGLPVQLVSQRANLLRWGQTQQGELTWQWLTSSHLHANST